MSDEEDDRDARHMNDTTMPPPPSRRGGGGVGSPDALLHQVTSTSPHRRGTDFPQPTLSPPRQPRGRHEKTSSTSSRRDVVKGFGLADWNRLVRRSTDLAQRRGRDLQRYRWSEIKRHDDVHDGWVVLRGKVYFVSPYLPYHPGGESILRRVLGKDITALYEKYHRWVNEDGLIGKLLIGYLDTSRTSSESESTSYLPTQVSTRKEGFAVPAPRVPKAVVAAAARQSTLGHGTANNNNSEDEDDKDPWDD